MESRSIRSTKILFWISLEFFILQFPIAISKYWFFLNVIPEEKQLNLILQKFSFFLYYLSFSTNYILYNFYRLIRILRSSKKWKVRCQLYNNISKDYQIINSIFLYWVSINTINFLFISDAYEFGSIRIYINKKISTVYPCDRRHVF